MAVKTLTASTKLFPTVSAVCFSKYTQNMRSHHWRIPTISRKFIVEWKLGLQCCRQDENRIGYTPALVQSLRDITFQGTWHTLFQEGWGGRCLGNERIHSYLPSCVWGSSPQFDDFCCPSRSPCHLTHTSRTKNSFSVQGFEHFSSNFNAAFSTFSGILNIKLGN